MTKSPLQPAVPLWLRVVILIAIVGFLWVSRRETAVDQTTSLPSTPTAATPKPVSVHVVGKEEATSSPAVTTPAPQPAPPPSKTSPETKPAEKTAPKSAPGVKPAKLPADKETPVPSQPLVIKNVTLKDQSGRQIYQGDVDLQPTLDRIAEGKLLDRFPHDGSSFQNRERRLPRQSSGYYKEYVVPTPKQNGPGPQRLVVGKGGEVFYTHDHYKTFRRVK